MESPTKREPSRPNIQQIPGPNHEWASQFVQVLGKVSRAEREWALKTLVQGLSVTTREKKLDKD